MTHPRSSRFFLGSERGPPAGPLQALLHPPLGSGAGEVGQLGADVGAVGGVQDVHELAEGELRRAEQRVGGESPVEVRLREPVHPRVHVGGAGPAVDLVHVERVDVRDAEAAVAVRADEAVDGPAAVVRGWTRAGRGRSPGPGRRPFPFELGEERTPSGIAGVGGPTGSGGRRLRETGRSRRRAWFRSWRTVRGGGAGAARQSTGSDSGMATQGRARCANMSGVPRRPGAPGRGRAGVPARAGCRAERCPPRQVT